MTAISSNPPAFALTGANPSSPTPTRSPENAEVREKSAQPAQDEQGLSQEELKRLSELKARDREVRAHEAAHQAAGGQYAGAMSFTYERGPDGAQYAVGGEVSIDMSPINGDPQATIEKMRVVRAAAMAPAEPSGQDRAVAAEAMQVMLQARSELASEQKDKSEDASASGADEPGTSRSRAAEQASNAYRSVAAMVDDSQQGLTGFGPVAA
ncbi:putative metalloprotease CJM1_0395 family protein [Marinobacter sp. F4206]|uniref:putative metalloprotease CJM1_0395 family protein n=1 Tax=Marinobacter sp. F4206 TaxID=2861777 RepID=UPI001C5D43DC|nr:putative metalloprotease CJM1_0395 family protein [Marinobacter sp. F4206]MBW4933884.1 hypothetical protein [Marinobacter sp. F4206]